MRQIRFIITRIRESVQHIRRNSFSMATSILYLLCLFIFLIDETRLEIMPAYAHWNTMLCIGEVVVFLLAATWKIPGSWLVILTSWIGLVTPFHVSAALIFGCMLAITLLGFNRLSYGISAVLLYFALHISVTYARHMPINRSDALLLLMTLMLCCFAGSILHRSQINADRLRQLMQLKHRQKAAIELHDRTCNNLTYAIRLIDERAHTQPSKTDMQEIRTVLQKSLSQTRKVISYLAADDSAETVPLTNNTHQLRQLDSIISEARHRLDQLSFQGEIINSITDLQCLSEENGELLFDILNELFSNIIKHADPEQGYFVTLGNPGKDIVIPVCDAPINSRSESEEPTTIGLLRYQEILQAHGGSMTIRSANHLWTATVTIPLINTSTSAATTGTQCNE